VKKSEDVEEIADVVNEFTIPKTRYFLRNLISMG